MLMLHLHAFAESPFQTANANKIVHPNTQLTMHPDEQANWLRVKEHMEKLGKTDNWYYRRACSIINTGIDTIEHPWKTGDTATDE